MVKNCYRRIREENPEIIIDFLVSKSRENIFIFDDRTISSSLVLEVLLKGFSIRNLNPKLFEVYGYGRGCGEGGFHSYEKGSGEGHGYTSGFGMWFSSKGAGLSPKGGGNGYGDSDPNDIPESIQMDYNISNVETLSMKGPYFLE